MLVTGNQLGSEISTTMRESTRKKKVATTARGMACEANARQFLFCQMAGQENQPIALFSTQHDDDACE